MEAIIALEELGLIVSGIAVLIDRQQGGREQLERKGYKLYASITIKEILDFYKSKGMISVEKYDEAIRYIQT